MNQQIALVIKFHGATNSKGARFSFSLPRWNHKRKVFSYDHSFNDTLDNALAVLREAGVPVAAILDLGNHYALAIEWANRPQVFKMMGISEN